MSKETGDETESIGRRSFLELTGSGAVLLAAGAGPALAQEDDLRERAKQVVAERTGADPDRLAVRNEGVATWSTLGERYYHAKVEADALHGVLLDADGAEIERETLDRREREAYADRYGKLDRKLHETVAAADADERIEVVVWVDGVDFAGAAEAAATADAADEAESKRALADERTARIQQRTRAVADAIEAATDADVKSADAGSPTVVVELPAEAVAGVQNLPGVARVAEHETDGYEVLVNTTKTHRTYSERATTYDAEGYPVGHAEFDHPDPDAALNFAGKRWDNQATGHPTVTAEAMASNDYFQPGTAYDADVYSADAIIGEFDDRMQWFDDNNVCAASFSIGIGASDRVLNDWDFRYGQQVYNNFLNLCVSAGNEDDGNYNVGSPSLGFNQISVASTSDYENDDWSDDAIAGYSCYEDPHSRHANPDYDDYPHDKPEISAVGSGVDTPSSDGRTFGTSLSAPGVAGLVALLCKFSDDFGTVDFSYYPEAVKAILMASARNDAGSWDKEGAGTISAPDAREVVKNGWFATGTYDKNNATQTYDCHVESGENVRVAVHWLTNVVNSEFSDNRDVQSDLDLDVSVSDPNGNYVAGSYEYDRGFEWLTFDADATGTYTIEVDKFRWDAEETYRWLGVAWHRE